MPSPKPGKKKRYIPVEIVQPILVSAVEAYRMSGNPTGFNYSAKVILAEEAGVQEHTINRIIQGKPGNNTKGNGLKLETVDKILTAAGLNHLWFQPPLDEYYNENTF